PLLQEIKNNPKVCKYIDIPLQHIDDKILKDMNRRSTEEQVRNLIDNIKTNYPEITIRSTFIIGFPGETRKQFKKLIEFLESAKLNNVGFFPFYKEEKTKAYFMKKQVPNFIKKLRLKKAEKIQEKVMNANNINLIGQETDVIIDYFDDDANVFVGRTNQNSPDVDFYIIFDDSDKIKAGEIYKAKITEYMNGIFKGEILS
ncbi:MAG: radical SAM protein, partial [Eubacteriales bacterium]|nr:radical SAM protein [Eubacteriales bacterium]